MTREDLLVWASQERAESLRQLDLFGSVGIKALLYQVPWTLTQRGGFPKRP